MITALAPLGATHHIQLVPSYDGNGNVEVSVLLRPKDSKDVGALRTVCFSGPIAEVETELAAKLPETVTKLVTHGNNLDELEKALAAEVEAKKEAASKKAETSGAKPADKKPTPAPTPKKEKTKPTTPAKPGLQRAGSSKPVDTTPAAEPAATASAAEENPKSEVDFGDLFSDAAPTTEAPTTEASTS